MPPLKPDFVPFWFKRINPISLAVLHDSYNGLLYVPHGALTLASYLNWIFRGSHIVPEALHPIITDDAHSGRVTPNGKGSIKAIHGITSCRTTLMYDLTSFSSYSQLINLLEYGYNRDDVDLPQLNLSMIVDKEKGIPVMYDIYPGSIVDVTTLKNTIIKIEAYGVENYTLVIDRGFFSKGNIEELVHEKIPFIMPATMALKSVKELMSSAQKDIESPEYLHKFNKKPIFVKPVTLEQKEFKINGYCFYDPKREMEEKNAFYSHLYDVKEKLEEKAIPGWRNAAEVFKERAREMASFYSWKKIDDHFRINIKKNAVSQRVNRMGKFFLFYYGEYDWMECLTSYRERDIVEKGFKIMKNDIQSLPLNTNKDSTTKGFIFICFIGLIIRMRLLSMMRETKIIEDYTVESLLLELEKIRKIELQNGKVIVTELTRKQKDIMEKLNLCA